MDVHFSIEKERQPRQISVLFQTIPKKRERLFRILKRENNRNRLCDLISSSSSRLKIVCRMISGTSIEYLTRAGMTG
jgi:hypothetical protein